MKTRIYDKHQSVNYLPFLICSVAFTDDEAYMIIGSTDLKRNINALVKNILEISKNFLSPSAALAFSWNGVIIGAHVISSQLEEARGRKGLKLIYGFEISPFTLAHKQNAFSSAFNLFHSYLAHEFNLTDLDLSNMDKIIEKFQQTNISPNDVITDYNLSWFFQELEVASFIDCSGIKALICKLRYIVNKRNRYALIQRRPFTNLKHFLGFWSEIDQNMFKKYNGSKRVALSHVNIDNNDDSN